MCVWLQMSEHKKEGVSIPKVLRTVIVAVQGPICFYLPIKAVLRVGVLLVVALDRQGLILATSDTPKWQGQQDLAIPAVYIPTGIIGNSWLSWAPLSPPQMSAKARLATCPCLAELLKCCSSTI